MRRAERFLEAGADVLFVESPESLEELRRVAETFKGAMLLANMVEGGRTPYLSTAELGAMGFKIALYSRLRLSDRRGRLADGLPPPEERRHRYGKPGADAAVLRDESVDGFPAVHAFEKRHGLSGNQSGK